VNKASVLVAPLFDIFKEVLHFCAEKTNNTQPYVAFSDNRMAYAGICIWRKSAGQKALHTPRIGLSIKAAISAKRPDRWPSIIKFVALHEFGHLINRQWRRGLTIFQAEVEAERFALAMAKRFYPDAYQAALRICYPRFKLASENNDVIYAALSIAFPEYREIIKRKMSRKIKKLYETYMAGMQQSNTIKGGVHD